MQTVKSKYTRNAKSATTDEIGDNIFLSWGTQRYEAGEDGQKMLILLDNPKVHSIDPRCIEMGDQRLHLPDYSPDLHQVIEHQIGALKHHVITKCYQLGWRVVQQGGIAMLRQIVVNYCTQAITPEVIQRALGQLESCYKIVACPRNQAVVIGHKSVAGVGGGYPSKAYR